MNELLEHIASGASLGFAYALIALGYTLVFGTLKFLNFAHGEIMMLSAFAGWAVAGDGLFGFFVAVAAAMLFGAACSVLLERTLIRPVISRSFMSPFITTLGASLILVSVTTSKWGTEPKRFASGLSGPPIDLGFASITRVALLIDVVAIAAMLLLANFVHRSAAGLQVRAAASQPNLARSLGVNTSRIAMVTMAVAGALAGVGGVLLAATFGVVSPFVGAIYGLKGIVAMIVGGIGSLRGAVVAGLMIGVGEVLIVAYVDSRWRDGLAFGLLVVVLLARPAGLFGRKDDQFVPHAA